MAKYRITSIPQSLPKAQNGGLKKLSTNIQNFVYPRLHPRGSKKTTPVVNEPMTEVQGVQENPMWNNMLSSVDKGETCPPGKYPYNDENGNWTGQCLTESEYQVATDKDFEDWDNKWDKKFNPIIQSIQDERRKLRTEDSDRRRNDYDESAKTYYETFNKSKKGDKIKPFQSLPTHVTDSKTPVIDDEGNPVLGEDGQPLMESFENQLKNKYLVIKNDRGFTDLYPKDIVHNRILKNGFQADQFVNYWGLDRKQVEEQMGPLMEGAMENYTSEVTQSVVKKAVNEGKTTDQVISELSPKVGTKTGLKTKFAEPTKKIIDDVYAQVQEELVNSLSGPTKSSWLDDNIFLSDNPVAAFEKSKNSMLNPREYLGYIKNKYERGDKEYNKYKKDPKNNYDPNYTYANIDDQFADMRSQVAAKKRVDYEVGAQEARKKGELTEFNDAAGKYISNLSANDLKYFINQALTKAGTTQAGKLDILNTVQNNPEKIYSKLLELESDEKVNGKTQTYSDLFSDAANTSFGMAAKHNKENIKNGNGINENTSGNKLRDVLKYPLDALYFAANPKEEMWGDSNLSYDTKLGIQKEKGVDLGVMGNDNPLSILRNFTPLQAFNPFKIGMNLRRGYDQGNLTSALGHELVDMGTSYGLGKGFNALDNLKYANRMAAGNNLLGSGLKNTIGLKKGLGTVLSGFNNPLMNLGMLASVPENIKDVKDEFEAGNYKSAALNALFAYWGAKPAFNTFKNLNALRKPGTVLSNPNFNTQYTGLYDAATPGSGIALGHPGLHTAEPVFESITNPLNKLGKGLGFGEFSILKQNQGLNTQPVNHSIDRLPSNFNRKNGGALQRLQGGGGVGQVVKALQELKPIVPEAKTISNQLSLFGADDFTNIIPVAQSGPIANFNVPVVGQTMPVVNNTVGFDLEKQIKKPNKFIYETNQDGDFLTSITKNKENDILRAYVENESGLGKTNMFDNEIKNLNLYTQLLDTYTSYLLPPKSKKFYKDLIKKIKQQDNFASKKQNEELQRLKTGNFDFTRKVYGSAEPKFNEGGELPKAEYGMDMQFGDPTKPKKPQAAKPVQPYYTSDKKDHINRINAEGDSLSLYNKGEPDKTLPDEEWYKKYQQQKAKYESDKVKKGKMEIKAFTTGAAIGTGAALQKEKYGGFVQHELVKAQKGGLTCPEGYTYDLESNTCIPTGNYEYIENPDDQRYKDYQIQNNLYKYSQLPNYYQKKDLSLDDILKGNFTEPWNESLKYYKEKLKAGDPRGINNDYMVENNDLHGYKGSTTKKLNIAPKDLNKFINKSDFLSTALLEYNWNNYVQEKAILKKFPPSSYQGFEQYGRDPYKKTFAIDRSKNEWTSPHTQFIEDEIDRKKLKSIYPKLTDADIDEDLKIKKDYPDYITNYSDKNTGYDMYDYTVDKSELFNGLYPIKNKMTPEIINNKIKEGYKEYKYLPKQGATSYLNESIVEGNDYQGNYLPMWNQPLKKYLLKNEVPKPFDPEKVTPLKNIPYQEFKRPGQSILSKPVREQMTIPVQNAVQRTMRVPVQGVEDYWITHPVLGNIKRERPVTTYKEVPWTDEAASSQNYNINTGTSNTIKDQWHLQPATIEGGFKNGGVLHKAQYGLESIGKMLKPTNEFRNTINSLHNVDDILPGISPIMRSMSKPKNTFIKTDVPKVDLTKYRNSSGGKSAIRYGNEPHPGEEWYNIDPADYDTNWKEEGLTDASNSLKKYLLNSPEHGPDLFKGVGEFKFKDLSDGWAARNAMMNMASDPQKMLGDNDFFSPSEFKNFLTNQKKWETAKSQFDEMNPEDPATAMWRAFSGNHERDELFSNLFPNVFLPNFRSKFTTPEQESFLRESDLENFTIPKRNALSKVSLNALSKNNNSTDKLPRSYQDLINASKDNFLNTSPVKDVVIEMRGILGLKIEDIQNARPEQLEKWRQKIITNMNKQKFDSWKYDISVPFTGGNAYKQISDVPGYKNKKGGVVTSLSKKEIDQYVKDGYIIEDH